MLKRLTIKNYALIKALEMEPSGDLNVITGETGAGKSIMLGAIGLLTGNRADTKVLWDTNQKCIIEGTFDIKMHSLRDVFSNCDLDYDDLTVIRREISTAGKSRAFINDSPVTLEVMRHIGGLLLDIHSQHENLLPGQQAFQLRLIDTYAGNAALKKQYAESWSAYRDANQYYEVLSGQADQLRKDEDYIRFQLEELLKAGLVEKEQQSLEAELKVMDHAEEIKGKIQQALELLTRSEFATRLTLASARNQLLNITGYSEQYEILHQRLDSLRIELDDIADELEDTEQQIEFDPTRANDVRERLDTIYRLQKKHQVDDMKGLLLIQDQLREKADRASNLDEALAGAKKRLDAAMTLVHEAAGLLSASRKKAFAPLVGELTGLLQELGIPEAQLSIRHQAVTPGESGTDHVDIHFSANKGISPGPLAQVASGGEFARLMLCIKYVLASRTSIPTLILDEIDSGVSGEIAVKLGALMKKMAGSHQLIAITHLPQIAARGAAHYHVFKDNSADKTVSNIRLLNKNERIHEIAQMIGGARPSATTLAGARELVEGRHEQ